MSELEQKKAEREAERERLRTIKTGTDAELRALGINPEARNKFRKISQAKIQSQTRAIRQLEKRAPAEYEKRKALRREDTYSRLEERQTRAIDKLRADKELTPQERLSLDARAERNRLREAKQYQETRVAITAGQPLARIDAAPRTETQLEATRTPEYAKPDRIEPRSEALERERKAIVERYRLAGVSQPAAEYYAARDLAAQRLENIPPSTAGSFSSQELEKAKLQITQAGAGLIGDITRITTQPGTVALELAAGAGLIGVSIREEGLGKTTKNILTGMADEGARDPLGSTARTILAGRFLYDTGRAGIRLSKTALDAARKNADEFATFNAGLMTDRSARLRSPSKRRVTKAELRKRSRNQAYDPRVIYETPTESLRKTGKAGKGRTYTERVISPGGDTLATAETAINVAERSPGGRVLEISRTKRGAQGELLEGTTQKAVEFTYQPPKGKQSQPQGSGKIDRPEFTYSYGNRDTAGAGVGTASGEYFTVQIQKQNRPLYPKQKRQPQKAREAYRRYESEVGDVQKAILETPEQKPAARRTGRGSNRPVTSKREARFLQLKRDLAERRLAEIRDAEARLRPELDPRSFDPKNVPPKAKPVTYQEPASILDLADKITARNIPLEGTEYSILAASRIRAGQTPQIEIPGAIITNQPPIIEEISATVTAQEIETRQETNIEPEILTGTKSETGIRTDLSQRTGQKIITETTQKPKLGLPPPPPRPPRLKITEDPTPRKPRKPIPPLPPKRIDNPGRTRRPGKTPPPPPPVKLPRAPIIPETKQPGYNVLVRRRGRFRKINPLPLTRQEAIDLGAYNVGTTAAATFKIEPAGAPAKGKSKKKGNILDFVQKGALYIERPRRRIKSLGELQEITLKGQRSKKKKFTIKNPFKGFKIGLLRK